MQIHDSQPNADAGARAGRQLAPSLPFRGLRDRYCKHNRTHQLTTVNRDRRERTEKSLHMLLYTV